MKKTNKISMAVLIIFAVVAASATFTGCTEEHTVESTLDELRATENTTTVHDTTVVVHDSVREVVITRTDTVTEPGESHEYTLRLSQWHNRWLGVSGGYLVGEDSVVLAKYEGAQLLQTWRTTARHRGTISLNVGTAAYPTTVIGDSCWLAAMGNGVYGGEMAGHSVVMTLGSQSIQGPVMLNGFDWAPYLVAHEAMGQRVRFDADGNARGFAIDADGRAAGFVTAPYPTTTPEDTSRRFLWADTNYTHLTTNPTGVWSGNQVKWSCVNRRTITEHYSSAPTLFTRDSNFLIWFPYTYSSTGSATPSMDGVTVNFDASGTATWTGGLSVTLAALPRQCSITPIPLPCQHSRTTATVHWNGGSPYVTMNGQLEGVTATATHTVPATNRIITSRDTSWNGCGSIVSSSLTSVMIQHVLARTGVVTLHYNIAPPTETINISESTMYYSQYMVSGSANPASIGTTASFTGNSVTIGGVTLTITPGAQPWCVLTYTSATLTSAGFVVTFTYNGGTGTVTIPVDWQNTPITGKRLIDGWISYAYQTNTSAPEEWVVLYTEDLATGQRYFEYIPWHTGNITYSEVTNIVAISSSDTNSIRTQINLGRYGARVYNHNSATHQWVPGMTHSTQNGPSSSTSWTVTFWFTNGTETNHVDLVVATTDINSGNSCRGHWNGTVISADGGSMYVSNL